MNETKTIEIKLGEPHAGVVATMKARGISARIFIELSSGDVERQMEALARLVVSHNLKDEEGKPLEDILEADLDILSALIGRWGEEVAGLPKV
jgi:hypothetical protein